MKSPALSGLRPLVRGGNGVRRVRASWALRYAALCRRLGALYGSLVVRGQGRDGEGTESRMRETVARESARDWRATVMKSIAKVPTRLYLPF